MKAENSKGDVPTADGRYGVGPMIDDRCPTLCDHDSRCTLPAGHGDRHETDHGCICYDPHTHTIALNNALSREADAVRRAESAEMGCEIAYRREPTQAEGDAHEYRNDQSMGASEAIRECHVPMGNHHGHRCLCGHWVWGGPTVCRRCVDAEAVKVALLRADTDARLWREEADRVGAVKLLLENNGCDCDCDHDAESHDSDCDRCLACRISWAVET